MYGLRSHSTPIWKVLDAGEFQTYEPGIRIFTDLEIDLEASTPRYGAFGAFGAGQVGNVLCLCVCFIAFETSSVCRHT